MTSFVLTEAESSALEAERRVAKTRGDFEWDRKVRALLLVGRDGLTKTDAAERCECSTRAIFVWQREFLEDRDLSNVRNRPRPGKTPRLTATQMSDLKAIILAGPEASGLATALWTSTIVANVIHALWEIRFHPSRVRKIMRELGLSHQLPRRRLAKADADAQQKWLAETLPRISQQAAAVGGRIFFPR